MIQDVYKSFIAWFDNNTQGGLSKNGAIDWLRCFPFVLTHLLCLAVFWVRPTTSYVVVCLALYAVRVFALTAFYHRYFSHRAFKTTRWFQFLFSIIAASAAQRGALWWAANHRHHHKYSDTPEDSHAPKYGFLRSHCGWFLDQKNFPTNEEYVRDWIKFPELVWLNRYDSVVPIALAVLLFVLGGWGMFIWGYCISTVLVYHVTFSVNSIAHTFGSAPFETKDQSRNNLIVALLTFGEGWHNNHHYYPSSARHGFRPLQLDITYLILKFLAAVGLVWGLRVPPEDVVEGKMLAARLP